MNPEGFLSSYEPEDEWEEEEMEDEAASVAASYACEECDYRWDVVEDNVEGLNEFGIEDDEVICPMCGSAYVTQI